MSLSLNNIFGKIPKFFRLLIFFLLAIVSSQIANKNYPKFDHHLLLVIQNQNNPAFDFIFKRIYQVTGVSITAIIVAITLSVFIWRRYWLEAKIFALGTLGILILIDQILKPFFDRRRPPEPFLVKDLGWDSFPSGHAAGNFVLYFYLSYIVAAWYPKLTVYVYSCATILLMLIGLSSIYVKAHWLTDILAGYGFGYVWLLICLNFLKRSNSKYKNKV
jgi:membrane-associated phospholipid phosphatase